ncbi:MAG: hypothetical protein JO117_09765 [Verrucomicrobia bacterium]|nr:hypothetical protein [Verrucomicrobiota bacterium]MBV9658840.1 hypothetical protein [Verrucomicrobiota bacterium]
MLTKARYPDFIARLFVHEETLAIPLPTGPLELERVIRLREADDATLRGGLPVADAALVPLVRAALFYFLNALPESHAILQKAEGDVAAYWHGMVHRREGDFDNARYWMRRAGEQPTFAELHARAADGSPNMARQMSWDPFLFINLCEQFRFGADDLRAEVVALGRAEFDVMFSYLWRHAVGKAES